MNRSPQLYLLVDRDLLRRLMQRTGTGNPVSVRDLAKAVGCAHGTIGNLLTGVQTCVSLAHAHGIVDRLGVDLLVLFTPTGRAVPAPRVPEYAAAVPA
jgi:hypothetical protein